MKANIEEIVEKIRIAIISTSCEWYGIRHSHYPVPVGDDVPFSWDWDYENDCSSDDMLNGASCVDLPVTNKFWDFDNMDEEEISEMNDIIKKALEMSDCYAGELMIVGGRHRGYGHDDNEILIDGIRIF